MTDALIIAMILCGTALYTSCVWRLSTRFALRRLGTFAAQVAFDLSEQRLAEAHFRNPKTGRLGRKGQRFDT